MADLPFGTILWIWDFVMAVIIIVYINRLNIPHILCVLFLLFVSVWISSCLLSRENLKFQKLVKRKKVIIIVIWHFWEIFFNKTTNISDLLPCTICNRKFASDRISKHKVKQIVHYKLGHLRVKCISKIYNFNFSDWNFNSEILFFLQFRRCVRKLLQKKEKHLMLKNRDWMELKQ